MDDSLVAMEYGSESYLTAKTALTALVVAVLTRVIWKVTSNVLFSSIPSTVPSSTD